MANSPKSNESIASSLSEALTDLPAAAREPSHEEQLASPQPRAENWESQGIFVKRRKRGFSQDNTPFTSPELSRIRSPEPATGVDVLPELRLDDSNGKAGQPTGLDFSEAAAAVEAPAPISHQQTSDSAAADTAPATADTARQPHETLPVPEPVVQLPKGIAGFASVEEFIFSAEAAGSAQQQRRVWGDCVDESSPCFGGGRLSPSPTFRGAAGHATAANTTTTTTWADLARHHRPQDRNRIVAPPVPPSSSTSANRAGREPSATATATAAVFVGSLKHYMDEKWVLRFFQPHGASQVLGSGNGFAVLELPEGRADAFIETFNGKKVDGKKLSVRPSTRPSAPTSATPNSPPNRS